VRGQRVLVAGAAAAAAATGTWLTLRARREVAYPPGPDALRPEDAMAVAEELAAQGRVGRGDRAIDFARTVATSVEPLLHGRAYFPRMLDDIRAATSSVHLLIYGWKPGDIGESFREALAQKVTDGLDVRLSVDAIGSEIDFGSRDLFRELRAAGIEIVANDGVLPDRDGQLGARRLDLHLDDFLHFDHRKMLIVDGQAAYVGGTGIEDHFNDERFYDVMCRVTGPVVAQLQLVFLTTWRYQGGLLPTATGSLAHLFPEPLAGPLSTAVTVLDNVPGQGHHPISDAIEQSLEAASTRIDIVNPYIADHAILTRLLAAAERGVEVRIVVPGKPTPPYPAAAFRAWYERLIGAGATILVHPEMAHAKVLCIDDRVLVGGCNLDDLSLFRNDELDLLLEGPEVVALFRQEILDPLAAVSSPAVIPSRPLERGWNAAMDAVARFL
jgi:cardiolipin synthase A/B